MTHKLTDLLPTKSQMAARRSRSQQRRTRCRYRVLCQFVAAGQPVEINAFRRAFALPSVAGGCQRIYRVFYAGCETAQYVITEEIPLVQILPCCAATYQLHATSFVVENREYAHHPDLPHASPWG